LAVLGANFQIKHTIRCLVNVEEDDFKDSILFFSGQQ